VQAGNGDGRVTRALAGRAGDTLVLGAGLALPFAFAPFDLKLLALLALPLAFLAWSGQSPGRGFWRGLLFGLGQFGVGASWVYVSIHRFGGTGPIAAAVLTGGFVFLMALYPAVLGMLLARWRRPPGPLLWVAVMPAAWVLFEWMRSWLLTGFPWLHLGYAFIDTPLDGFAPVGGVYLMSWAVAASAGLVLAIALRRAGRVPHAVALAAVWLAGLALAGVAWVEPAGEPMQAALVQGAIPQQIKWAPAQRAPTLELYRELTASQQGADIVVWPETAVPAMYQEVEDELAAIAVEVMTSGGVLMTGLAFRNAVGEGYYNSLAVLGETPEFYFKRHLVPFGEYVPFFDWIGPVFNILGIPASRFIPGHDEVPVVEVAGQPAGVSICYEAAFGEEIIDALPRAALLVNISNDAWFGDSLAPHQHLQMARLRALETGRYMLRATNTGISAIIDEGGAVTARSPQHVPYVVRGEFRPMQGATPYVRAGNTPVLVAAALVLVLALAISLRRRA